MDLYKRYVDDIVIVIPPITKGWQYDTGKSIMVYSKEREESDNCSENKRTANTLISIANPLEKAL